MIGAWGMLTRRRGCELLAIVGVLAVGFVLWRIHRSTIVIRDKLIAAGFPESYAVRLADLKRAHPAWSFEPLMVADLPWEKIIDRECAPAQNLVVRSKWAPDEWLRLGEKNYMPYYAENAKTYDSGRWYQASREAIAYFMDPRNFFVENEVFMFESLSFNEMTHTVEAIEKAFSGSFMAQANYDGGGRRFSELVLDVGRKLGISPVFLAARLTSEQGMGTVQAMGKIGDSLVELHSNRVNRIGDLVVWGKTFTADGRNTVGVTAAGRETYNGYYNFFNTGACGSGVFEIRYNAWREATGAETVAKYGGPWDSQEKAIRGGAIKIKERYIDTFRHTRYFQKFSVVPAAGAFRWKQYMQNIAAPLVEARGTFKAYRDADVLEAPYRFVIPVFKGLPPHPCPDPAQGKSVYSPQL